MGRRIGAAGMLLVLAVAQSAFATDTVVEAGSADLQAVIDAAGPGDRIILKQGIYVTQAALTIREKQGLSLVGLGEVSIVCQDVVDDVIRILDSEDILLLGIRARHEPSGSEAACEGAVVSIDNALRVAIQGCSLRGCGAVGVYAGRTHTLTVTDSVLQYNSFAAFHLVECDEVSIKQNTITRNGAFLFAYGVRGMEISGNAIAGNGTGTQ
jgi:nitrous oxidase accessory protein NosD